MPRSGWIIAAVAVLASLGLGFQNPAPSWIEDTFEDFADGRCDAAGQNLYVARDGTVRTIHRFDLNQDSYLDLIFNSTHDTSSYLPAVSCSVGAGRDLRRATLPVEGSLRVVVDDLNRDGRLDAVFCPNDSGLQNPRRFLTILWGGPEGWIARRSNGLLPVHDARTLAIIDLDRDGWRDIAVLNGKPWIPGQPTGAIVRIFWGSEAGFLLDRTRDLGVPGALDLAAADFDGDGAPDLAVLASDRIHIFWSGQARAAAKLAAADLALPPKASARALTAGDSDGDGRPDLLVGTESDRVLLFKARANRTFAPLNSVAASPASHIAVGDLDGDRRPDLVLTNFVQRRAQGGESAGAARGSTSDVRILWGGAAGFETRTATALEVASATASAIGDLDGDQRPDLSVSVYQDKQSFAGESVVFFNAGGRRFERSSRTVRTDGGAHVAYAGPEQGIPARAVFASATSGTLGEAVPLDVYWGVPGGFDPARHWEIPFRSGYESSAADLNADGYVDLIAMNSQHGGATDDPLAGANIFWGSKSGFDLEKRRTVLSERNLASSTVADFDRDGFLDLILGAFASPGQPSHIVIYYGSASGYSPGRRMEIAADGNSISLAVADFNRDDWLDIAVVSAEQDLVRIFWGSKSGVDAGRQAKLHVPFALSLETADLNGDGWLDLVVGSYGDRISGTHDTGVTLLWGSKQGFHHWDAQWLPASTPIGSVVADFDTDGRLDLFLPPYLGELTRESMPSYLYWGGPDGFEPRRRTTLLTDSAHDAMAGDFDRDGRLDLAVSCHTRDGDHHTASKVFFNDGARFRNPRVQELPTRGTHWMWDQDMGHIYDRKWRQIYESSIFRWSRGESAGRLTHRAEVPPGTRLAFEVRSAPGERELESVPWRPAEAGRFTVNTGDRALQYRAIFHSDNGDRYPVLDRVELALESGGAAGVKAGAELVSVERIWDQGAHNAFTDLIRFQDRWYCTFREGQGHVGGDGRLRVLESRDGRQWESAALLSEQGIDLRDPKLSITPDGRLMIVAGGSVYRGKELVGRRPRVAFSRDGRTWTSPQPILSEGEWLWRVTWHEGRAWGVSYSNSDQPEWSVKLFSSPNGVDYEMVGPLDIQGRPNETTLRFLSDGTLLALVRRDPAAAVLGTSRSPFRSWTWRETGHRVGGPNFIVLPDGSLWGAGRSYDPEGARTAVAAMTLGSYEPVLRLPSGGDTSYPGMVWHDGLLWLSFYSSHEGKSAIYLAQLRLRS